MKGQNIASNPALGGVFVSREVSETNGNHSLKKGQADARCRFEKCSNGQPVPDRMHNHHKNNGFSQAVMCENGHAIVPENCEDLDEGNTESARALQRICSAICSHPSRRPTGKVVSVIKKSPRRGAVVGFLAPFSEFPDGEQRNQMNLQGSKRMNHKASSSLPCDLSILGNEVHIGDSKVKCCSLVQGIAGPTATSCLYMAIKAKVLDLSLYVPLALKLLVNDCGCAVRLHLRRSHPSHIPTHASSASPVLHKFEIIKVVWLMKPLASGLFI